MSWVDRALKKHKAEQQKQTLAKQIKDELLKDGELNRRINKYGEEMKQGIQDENTEECLKLFYSCVAVALHEQHHFGAQRILKLFRRIDELFGEADTVMDRCKDEVGISIEIN